MVLQSTHPLDWQFSRAGQPSSSHQAGPDKILHWIVQSCEGNQQYNVAMSTPSAAKGRETFAHHLFTNNRATSRQERYQDHRLDRVHCSDHSRTTCRVSWSSSGQVRAVGSSYYPSPVHTSCDCCPPIRVGLIGIPSTS